MTAFNHQAPMDNKIGSTLLINYSLSKSLLGYLLVAKNATGIFSIELGDHKTDLTQALLATHPSAAQHECHDLKNAHQQLQQFFTTTGCPLDFPLDLQGTDFQKKVWQAIAKIPYGKTVSYSELATQMGAPQATRAVASACGQNKLALVIPCHRVVRQDGTLSGFRWGIERKKKLLAMEQNA